MLTARRLYNYYYYNSPLPVLNSVESVAFNTVNILLLTLGTYYIGKTIQVLT